MNDEWNDVNDCVHGVLWMKEGGDEGLDTYGGRQLGIKTHRTRGLESMQ